VVRMPLPRRVQRVPPRALYFDGVDDYVVVPLTVYGWPGITVMELQYPFWPKANSLWSKYTMLGDPWADKPSFYWFANDRLDYTTLSLSFGTRRPDGTRGLYEGFSIYAYRNSWISTAWSFDLASRKLTGYINGNSVYTASIPSDEITVLEWNPSTATYPQRYRQLVLGANVLGSENMKLMQAQILVYSRALSPEEILWNYMYPDNPIRNGLVLWLHWDSIDVSRGIWYDKSGYGNHGTIYGATLVQIVKQPRRILSPSRILAPAR